MAIMRVTYFLRVAHTIYSPVEFLWLAPSRHLVQTADPVNSTAYKQEEGHMWDGIDMEGVRKEIFSARALSLETVSHQRILRRESLALPTPPLPRGLWPFSR